MLDLDSPEVTLPPYELKVQGKVRQYDTLVLGYRLRVLEGVEDPGKICEVVKEALELADGKLSTFEACLILNDFKEFTEREADEPLKKVFGRSLFSHTTTDSAPEKSES